MDLTTCFHLVLKLIMDETRSTCNPHAHLHGVDWGNFTVSCVQLKLFASLPLVPFSSFGFSIYVLSDITVFISSSIM